jgi:hypothetical protein
MHAYERDTPMRWPYEMAAYETAYGRCTLMGWPSMGCIPCEMHTYGRCAYEGDMPMRWPL